MKRRTLLAAAVATPWANFIATALSSQPSRRWRVGVIGHTGRGNYGHGLDTVWMRIPSAEIVAVCDPDKAGLQSAKQRLKTDVGFGSYQKMLAAIQPDIVAICPRHPDQHHNMALAAIDSGARGIYVEKPFCRTPAEADAIVKSCKAKRVKLAVAHRNRYHPVLAVIDKMIATGQLGKILEIRGRGKGDRRGGTEDLWVLGSHVLNLVHYFGGAPKSCSALIKKDGRLATARDVYPGNEGLGPLIGNELHARFDMERGMVAYFDSIANDGTQNAGFGLQIVGSLGLIDINCDRTPLAFLVPGNPFKPSGTPRPWTAISTDGVGEAETKSELIDAVLHHDEPVRDLLSCIVDDKRPKCNVHEAAATVEMISAVFASHVEGGRAIPFPLDEREHPLTRYAAGAS